MTDRQNSEVLTWVKTHSSVTSHSLSQNFGLPLEEARSLLKGAVDALGRDQFRLIYCRHDSVSRAFTLNASDSTMDVESEDMILFAVQYKQVTREAALQADRTERSADMERALTQGTVIVHENAGIHPMEVKVRELLPHRKKKTVETGNTGQVLSGSCQEKMGSGSGGKPQSAIPRGKPSVLKSQSKLHTSVQAKIEDRAPPESPSGQPPPSSKPHFSKKPPPTTPPPSSTQPPEASSPHNSSQQPPSIDPVKPSQSHVSFTDNPSHVDRAVKRRSTPHPSKHSKHSEDSMEQILSKTSLYTVEEDDTEATPQVSLKRKLDETTEQPTKKTSERVVSTPAETEASQVPTEGYKRVKFTTTETFLNEKGYMISKDVVKDEIVKVKTMPQKPVVGAHVAHKKGKQTEIGAFFGSKS